MDGRTHWKIVVCQILVKDSRDRDSQRFMTLSLSDLDNDPERGVYWRGNRDQEKGAF